MPGMSSRYGGGQLPGLTLKAWALFSGATGAVVKGFNVASVVRGGAGSYTVNFSTPMATAAGYFATVQENYGVGASHAFSATFSPGSSNSAALYTYLGAATTDYGLIFVAVYE